MRISRWLLALVTALGILAVARLGLVTRDYDRAIATLQRVEFGLRGVERVGPEELRLLLEIHNDSSLPITVRGVQLYLYQGAGVSVGATYERIPATAVAPYSTVEVPSTLTILYPDRVPEHPTSLTLTGSAAIELPFSDRQFSRQVVVSWADGS